jgi:serine O-acetyltransferase
VPPGVTVVGIPGRVVTKREKPHMDLEHGKLPDPVAEALKQMIRDHRILKERLKKLEEATGIKSVTQKAKSRANTSKRSTGKAAEHK